LRFHIRIFLLLLLANVLTRFFTNYLGVLPRHFNIADVGLTLLLWGLSWFHPAPHPRSPLHRAATTALVSLVVIGGAGFLLNAHPGHLPAAASQVLMLAEPLLLLVAMSRLGLTAPEVAGYVKWLERLIWLELVIGICQVPIFLATGESESIMGTFQHNAEHYAAFITLGMFFLIGKLRVEESGNLLRKLMIVGMLALVICVDNKASWLGLATSLFLLLLVLGALEGRLLGLIAAAVAGVVVLIIGVVIVVNVSGSLHKFERLAEIWRNGDLSQLGKVKAVRDIVASNVQHPHMWLIGSGPGSFYSRASHQFFGENIDRMYRDISHLSRAGEDYKASNSMGGVITLADKDPYYYQLQTFGDEIVPVGTSMVDQPFSFFHGILGEFGLMGTLLYLVPYWVLGRTLRRVLLANPRDRQIVPLAAATYGFLIYLMVNSIYGPMLETGRMTTILWSLAACCLVFERTHSPGVDYESHTGSSVALPPESSAVLQLR
jgi:hypothetical protein